MAMKRLMMSLLALSLLAAACGSDGDDPVSGAVVVESGGESGDPQDTTTEVESSIGIDGESEGPVIDEDDTPTTTAGASTTVEPTTVPETVTTVEGEPGDTEPPTGDGPYPAAELMIDVALPSGASQVYSITCAGEKANVVGTVDLSADGMCSRLLDPSVQDLLINGFPRNIACTQQFGSAHRAQFTGSLDGAAVDFSVGRNDGCGIDAWDRTFADVLPPADS